MAIANRTVMEARGRASGLIGIAEILILTAWAPLCGPTVAPAGEPRQNLGGAPPKWGPPQLRARAFIGKNRSAKRGFGVQTRSTMVASTSTAPGISPKSSHHQVRGLAAIA
jgi:hypothetical protein